MDAAPAPLAERMLHVARHRCERFVVTSLRDLFVDSDAFLDIPESLVALLADQRTATAAVLDGWRREVERGPSQHPIITMLSDNARRFIKRNNQFVVANSAIRDVFAVVYTQWLTSLFHAIDDTHRPLPEALRAMLTQHRLTLRESVIALGLAPHGNAAGPLCREYSPELQIAMLHLDAWGITSPLLDLGCGEQAWLVRALRRRHVQALGLDAFAPADAFYLMRGNWLATALGHARWGTIVSHMAFSHHFLHHHLTGSEDSVAYARRYMDVLAALQPGGCFIYTPGLPFIEDVLPRERFQVKRRALPSVQGTQADQALTGLVGRSTFYTACVQRRA